MHSAHTAQSSMSRLAFRATVHCLTGCGFGEVLGLVIATALGWHDLPSIMLAVTLAFIFGYALTLRPLLASGMGFVAATKLALAADTISIAVMEVVDNAVMLAIPGAMESGLGDLLFWGSLAFALAVAFAVAFPVNMWLIKRGRGHAVVHAHHDQQGDQPGQNKHEQQGDQPGQNKHEQQGDQPGQNKHEQQGHQPGQNKHEQQGHQPHQQEQHHHGH